MSVFVVYKYVLHVFVFKVSTLVSVFMCIFIVSVEGLNGDKSLRFFPKIVDV